jgi:putative ABC transport system permease protein
MALPISYNIKNLFVRKISTAFTVLGVAVVVFVFTALSAFVDGIRSTLKITSDRDNVIVLKQGATAESNSAVSNEEVAKLLSSELIARRTDAKGRNTLLAAPEYLTIAGMKRRGDNSGNVANVPVRGVCAESFLVHDKVRWLEGVDFDAFINNPGKQQVIVGKAAARQYDGLQIGGKVPLGFRSKDTGNEFEVVGVFEAGGGVFESEIWVYGGFVKDVYKRDRFSSVTVKVVPSDDTEWQEDDENTKTTGKQVTKRGPSAVRQFAQFAAGPTVGLTAFGEAEYFDRQTETTKPFVFLSYGLLIFMGIAAGFAVANNMYAMVAGRMREIAMLRAIGFPPASVITCFIIESLMLAGMGGLLGCGAALVILKMLPAQDMIGGGGSFTAIVFNFNVTPQILATSMAMALVLGLVGSLFPALKAGRTPVVTALRQA